MNIRVVDSNGDTVESESKEFSGPQGSTIPDGELMTFRMAQIFDLDHNEVSKYKSKLNDLIKYAKTKTEDHSPEGLKWAIRQLGVKLGTPPLGEKLIPYLHRFAYLSMEARKIDNEKKKFLEEDHDIDN